MRWFSTASAKFLTACSLLVASVAAGGTSCPDLFERIARQDLQEKFEASWSAYNRALQEKVGGLKDERVREAALERARAIAKNFASLQPDFPEDDFEIFLRRDWQAGVLPSEDQAWGEALDEAYSRFLRPFESEARQLAERASEWSLESRQVLRSCGTNLECLRAETSPISMLIKVRKKIAGTCLAKSPTSAKGLALDLAMTWGIIGGYFVAGNDHRVDQFAFAYALNSTLWSWVLGEKHCQSTVAATLKLPFGKPLSTIPDSSWKSQALKGLRAEVGDWKWAPAMAASSIALSVWFDTRFQKDRPEGFYPARFSFMTLYNVGSGPIRRILVWDPVFKKAFPLLQPWVEKMVKSGRMAELITRQGKLGVDFGLRVGEWEMWGMLQDSFMKSLGIPTK